MKNLLMIMAMVAVIAMAGTASAVTIDITTAYGIGADGSGSEADGTAAVPVDLGDGTGINAALQTQPIIRQAAVILRFDLSQIVPGSVTSATLRLVDGGGRTSTINYRGVIEGSPNEGWNEATFTASTAPGIIWDGDAATAMEDFGSTVTTLLGQQYVATVTGQVWTFTSAPLLTFLNADTDGMVNIVLTDVSARHYVATKEGTYDPPTLLLEADLVPPIPEPAGLGLLGVALLAMRRRRS